MSLLLVFVQFIIYKKTKQRSICQHTHTTVLHMFTARRYGEVQYSN